MGEGAVGRTRATALLAALVVAAASAALPEPAGAQPARTHFRLPAQQIVCESEAFRRQECPADTRGGVRLLEQTSGICTRGQTWGTTPRGVWVTNGCRAIFAVVPGPGARPPVAGRLVVCESWQFRRTRCAVPLRHAPRAEVIAGTCRLGRTWRWNRRGIVVENGCRARFLVG